MAKLVFDIETVGEDFESLDATTQEGLTRWIRKETESEKEFQIALEELKNGLGFSPLTGEIVVIGLLDAETGTGDIYFQAPGKDPMEFAENGLRYHSLNEKEMLTRFWQTAKNYHEFISFNGRSFDAPFLLVRSATYGIKPSKDLMSNRYLGSQKYGSVHIDLLDQLTFYGAVRRKGSLHLWCRLFGIKSPKAGGITGEDIGRLFKEGKFVDIARYNAGDLFATRALYDYWERFIKF